MLMRDNGSLTQKGRLLRTFIGVAALATALLLAPRAFADDSAPAAGSLGYDTYTVASGETLWQIADSLTPTEGSIAETVQAIMELNDMNSAAIVAGEQIIIPLA